MSSETTDSADASVQEDVGRQAAQIAGGASIVMVGGVAERGVRMVITWLLSNVLGTAGFGVYSFVVTVVSMSQALVPLGADVALTMFGARYLRSQEHGRLKAVLLTSLGMVLLTGPMATFGLWMAIHHGLVLQGQVAAGKALMLASGAVGLGAALAVVMGGLIARKDMVGQAWVQQLGLPLCTLLGVLVVIGADAGLDGVILAFVLAHLMALLAGLVRFWSHFGPLLRQHSVHPEWELGSLLRYALPQTFARVLYRANLWIDIVMLTYLATMADVGIYRVSVALAMLGALPVMASTTMFGPVVAGLVYSGELKKLDALLRIVTRWLIVVAAPLYITVLVLPDIVLSIFDPAYQAGAVALGVLMLGQAIYVACAPAGACLTMAGYSKTNLLNGVLAVSLNIALNMRLIPDYGILGAAYASTIALSFWSLLRVVEVRFLLKCSPWSIGAAMVMVVSLIVGIGIQLGVGHLGWLPRIVATGGGICILLAVFWRFGRTPEDEAVFDLVRAKFGRLG
jgi:O-antigen/teichoic acid export membrane protein